jgi:hypothetical protein
MRLFTTGGLLAMRAFHLQFCCVTRVMKGRAGGRDVKKK